MNDVSQISRDHGLDTRDELAGAALPPLAVGVAVEDQLKAARRAVCVPGQASLVCTRLVEMSLRLAADAGTEAGICDEYEELRQTMPQS